jgi:hypothetical protein
VWSQVLLSALAQSLAMPTAAHSRHATQLAVLLHLPFDWLLLVALLG